MPNPELSIIAALSENNVIGNKGRIPWHIPEDLRRFKQITWGHPIIMGRRTFDSIGRPLPGRTNIVITRDESFENPDLVVVHSLDEAIEQARRLEMEEIFVIGGGQIYKQAIDSASCLYLTIVRGIFEGDTFFPDYSDFSRVIEEIEGQSGQYQYRLLVLEKEDAN